MTDFSLTSLDFRSTQILHFMICNNSSRLWWNSALSTMSIYRWTCSPPSPLPKLLFAIFLKYLKCSTPVSVKKVKLALNWSEFPSIQRRSLQQLKQNIYLLLFKEKESRRGAFSFLGIKGHFGCSSWSWIHFFHSLDVSIQAALKGYL